MLIPKDSTPGRRQFERLMEDRRAMDDPETFKGLRRGWFLGDKTFREELLEQMVLNGADGKNESWACGRKLTK